jgi:hypothetical protein
MKTKVKLSLMLWAVAALFLSCWSVKFAMTGIYYGNSEFVTFTISLCASLVSAVCGAGFMQQWMKK